MSTLGEIYGGWTKHGCVSRCRTLTWWTSVVSMVLFWSAQSQCEEPKQFRLHTAVVNLTYKDPVTHTTVIEGAEMGRYALNSPVDPEHGLVVHVRTSDGANHGCTPPINIPNDIRWIALVERGDCKFAKKVFTSTVNSKRNASAVVIYNHKDEDRLVTMDHNSKFFHASWHHGMGYGGLTGSLLTRARVATCRCPHSRSHYYVTSGVCMYL